MKISEREEYITEHSALTLETSPKDPAQLFQQWYCQAQSVNKKEANILSLATCSAAGRPSSRAVLLREYHRNHFIFHSNYQSRKAKEIEQNPFVALNFTWYFLHQQIRIEGHIQKLDAHASDEYFSSRPLESQVTAILSKQSHVLSHTADFQKQSQQYLNKYAAAPEKILRPHYWGGFLVTAFYYEFWQGRKSRRHERLSYTREEASHADWKRAMLYP